MIKDRNGNEWSLDIDVTGLKRVRELVGHDFLNPTAGDAPLLSRARIDVSIVFDAMYALMKPQAEQRGLNQSQFESCWKHESGANAIAAFWSELTDFFQWAAPMMTKAIAALHRIVILEPSATSSPASSELTPDP